MRCKLKITKVKRKFWLSMSMPLQTLSESPWHCKIHSNVWILQKKFTWQPHWSFVSIYYLDNYIQSTGICVYTWYNKHSNYHNSSHMGSVFCVFLLINIILQVKRKQRHDWFILIIFVEKRNLLVVRGHVRWPFNFPGRLFFNNVPTADGIHSWLGSNHIASQLIWSQSFQWAFVPFI